MSFQRLPRDHTVVENLLGAVDVGEEAVDRLKTLQQALSQGRQSLHDHRQGISEDPFAPLRPESFRRKVAPSRRSR